MRKAIVLWLAILALFALLVLIAFLYEYMTAYHTQQLQASLLSMPPEGQLLALLFGVMTVLLVTLAALQTSRVRWQYGESKKLKERLAGLRLALNMSAEQQREAEAAARVMEDTDPKALIMSLHKRITETERQTAAQKSHNDVPDLSERLKDIQIRQTVLREEIGKLIERRRASSPLLSDSAEQQEQVEKALKELENVGGGKSLKQQLAELLDDNANAQKRTDEVKEAFSTISRLHNGFDVYRNDLLALQDRHTGVAAVIDLVRASQIDLTRALDKLELGREERLSICVERLLADKSEVERRMAAIGEQVSTLHEVQQDVAILDRKKRKVAELLAEAQIDEAGRPIADRLNELTAFTTEALVRISATQDLARRLKELDAVLTSSQAALEPLKGSNGEIKSLLSATGALRNELTRSLDELESSGAQTSLAARVKELIEWKRTAELRIDALNATLKRLAGIKAEMDALFTSVMDSLSAHMPIGLDDDGRSRASLADGTAGWEKTSQLFGLTSEGIGGASVG